MSDLKAAVQNEIERRKSMKGSNFNGALVGAGIAAGMELISTKGGLGSAIAAATVGGLVGYKMKPILDAIDQDKNVQITAGIITFGSGSLAGSIWRSYFPNGEVDTLDY